MNKRNLEERVMNILVAVRDKETDVIIAKEEIVELLLSDYERRRKTIEIKIKLTMDEIGVPQDKAIHKYLYLAMMLIYEHPDEMLCPKTQLYIRLSEMCNVSNKYIYQVIWRFIQNIWYMRSIELVEEVARMFKLDSKSAPGNLQFFKAFYKYIIN